MLASDGLGAPPCGSSPRAAARARTARSAAIAVRCIVAGVAIVTRSAVRREQLRARRGFSRDDSASLGSGEFLSTSFASVCCNSRLRDGCPRVVQVWPARYSVQRFLARRRGAVQRRSRHDARNGRDSATVHSRRPTPRVRPTLDGCTNEAPEPSSRHAAERRPTAGRSTRGFAAAGGVSEDADERIRQHETQSAIAAAARSKLPAHTLAVERLHRRALNPLQLVGGAIRVGIAKRDSNQRRCTIRAWLNAPLCTPRASVARARAVGSVNFPMQ